MPRQIEYNKNNVLSLATDLFIRRGYEATSMGQLVKNSGMNRHSMYKEFGDKEGLFLACVNHYTLEQQNLDVMKILNREPLGIKNVEEFLKNRVEYALSENCYGCLLVNTVSEREVTSEKINDKIEKIIASLEGSIFRCIEAAINKSEISANNDARALTDYLSCFFRGLMNFAKHPDKNKTSMKKMGVMALSSIIK